MAQKRFKIKKLGGFDSRPSENWTGYVVIDPLDTVRGFIADLIKNNEIKKRQYIQCDFQQLNERKGFKNGDFLGNKCKVTICKGIKTEGEKCSVESKVDALKLSNIKLTDSIIKLSQLESIEQPLMEVPARKKKKVGKGRRVELEDKTGYEGATILTPEGVIGFWYEKSDKSSGIVKESTYMKCGILQIETQDPENTLGSVLGNSCIRKSCKPQSGEGDCKDPDVSQPLTGGVKLKNITLFSDGGRELSDFTDDEQALINGL